MMKRELRAIDAEIRRSLGGVMKSLRESYFMQSSFLAALGIGLVVIALVIGGVFYMQRGDVMQLPGAILKVRTAPLDEQSSVAILDFRVSNPSNVVFQVRSVTLELEGGDGKSYEGQPASDGDTQRLFDGLPILGRKYNKTLQIRERINAHASADRMIAARFQAPVSLLDGRKRFVIHVEEADGVTVEIKER
jgi:hypothetical protein